MEYLTTPEVCAYLNKSDKTIQRYVRKGVLHPELIKSDHGAAAYRFSKKEVEDFKQTMSKTSPRHVSDVRPPSDMSGMSETLTRTIELLTKQLEIKDKQLEKKDSQIQSLSDRLRESNVLLRSEQEARALPPGHTGQTSQTNVPDTAKSPLFPTLRKLFSKKVI